MITRKSLDEGFIFPKKKKLISVFIISENG